MGEVELCKLRCEKCGQLKVNCWRRELEGTPDSKDDPDKSYQPVLCYECAKDRVLVKDKFFDRKVLLKYKC